MINVSNLSNINLFLTDILVISTLSTKHCCGFSESIYTEPITMCKFTDVDYLFSIPGRISTQ